jgi:hypothetical protein
MRRKELRQEEMRKNFLEQVKKVPTQRTIRKMFRNGSIDQLSSIMRSLIDYETLTEYLTDGALGLRKSDIKNFNSLFKIALAIEFSSNDSDAFYADEKFFDLEDRKTRKMLADFEQQMSVVSPCEKVVKDLALYSPTTYCFLACYNY